MHMLIDRHHRHHRSLDTSAGSYAGHACCSLVGRYTTASYYRHSALKDLWTGLMNAGHVLLLHRDQHCGLHSAHSGRLGSHHSVDRHVSVRRLHAHTSGHHSIHSHRSVNHTHVCLCLDRPISCLYAAFWWNHGLNVHSHR